jgi:hypothetical protein
MAQRVIVQTQDEYATMNRAYIKWAFFIGTFIIGIGTLTGRIPLPYSLGIILLLPLIIWIIFKIYRKVRRKDRKIFFIILAVIVTLVLVYFLLPKLHLNNFNMATSSTDYKSMCEKECGGSLNPNTYTDTQHNGYQIALDNSQRKILLCNCADGTLKSIGL